MKELTKDELREAVSDLEKGRKIISDPNVWVRGKLGTIPHRASERYTFYGHRDRDRDARGDDNLGDCEKVCSLGALGKAKNLRGSFNFRDMPAALFLGCAMSGQDDLDADTAVRRVVGFNDNPDPSHARQHRNVLKKWDDAIKRARDLLAKAEKTEGQ